MRRGTMSKVDEFEREIFLARLLLWRFFAFALPIAGSDAFGGK